MRNLQISYYNNQSYSIMCNTDSMICNSESYLSYNQKIFTSNISQITQNISYNSSELPSRITEGSYDYHITYSSNMERIKTVRENNKIVTETKYYFENCEKITNSLGRTKWVTYIDGPNGLASIIVSDNGTHTRYFTYTDYLGSILTITNSSGAIITEQNFDAWGRRRDANTWDLLNVNTSSGYDWLSRGFTGHEHLDQFALINMNARLYDPVIGRMLSPDNVQADALATQAYNRYSYALNNPLKYTDPSGEFIIPAIIIGAIAGGYMGYKIADAKGYDFSDIETYAYILGGATIGGATGWLGATITASGGFMANTMGIMYSSSYFSAGMSGLSGGMLQPSISFGAFSLSVEGFNWLGKKGNSFMQNLSYFFGALSNIQDVSSIIADLKSVDNLGNKIQLDKNINVKAILKIAGHSWTEGDDILISVGPAESGKAALQSTDGLKWESQYFFKNVKGENFIQDPKISKIVNTKLYNVNTRQLIKFTENLALKKGLFSDILTYGAPYGGCVNINARALLFSGVVNVNAILPATFPLLLNFELAIRNLANLNSYILQNFEF